MALAQDPTIDGCMAEALGDQVAVFCWTTLARPAQKRWTDVVALAEGLDVLLDAR